MIVVRIQLHCDEEGCNNYFPVDGAVDGAIFTFEDLRKEAKRTGWVRTLKGFGIPGCGPADRCPSCDRKRFDSIIQKNKAAK